MNSYKKIIGEPLSFNGELGEANKIIRNASRKAREAGIEHPRYLYIPKHHEYSSLLLWLCIDRGLVGILYDKDQIFMTQEKIK